MHEHSNWATLVEDTDSSCEIVSSYLLVNGSRPVLQDRIRVKGGPEKVSQYRPRGPRAVFVVPVTTEGQAVLIRQYRHPLRATITEVVAGGVEAGESVLQAAQRELREEVGGEAVEWMALPGFYPLPSGNGVVYYSFLALGVRLGEQNLEPTEIIDRFTVPLAEAYSMLERGDIQCAGSCLTLWQARASLQARGFLF